MQNSSFFARASIIGIALGLLGTTQPGWSQTANSFEVPATNAPLTAADLETLVGPIALYPDDLVGIILPASTYPLQIVQASRFLDDLEQNPNLQPDPNWDSSVVALLNYPELLRMLDANIEWTWALGEAVLDEQAAVMDAIQVFRRDAMLAGNLSSDAQQTVTQSGDLIEIAPADPEVIYIPYYEPERVVIVQPRPVIHYYADPYPLYYYPYPFGYRFRTGFFWGVTTAFHIGWHSHVLNVYHHHHHLHPFYGRTYYTPFYARRGVNININVNRANPVWRPRQYRAARPHRISNGTRVTVSREGSRNATTRTRSAAVTRTTRSGSAATQTRAQVNRNAQRNTTATRYQGARQQNARQQNARQQNARQQNARQQASRQQNVRQPTFSSSGNARGTAQRADRQRGSAAIANPRTDRQRSNIAIANPRTDRQRAGAAPGNTRTTATPTRPRATFASPQRNTSSANRNTAVQTRPRTQAPSARSSAPATGQRNASSAAARTPRAAAATGGSRSSSRQTGAAGRSSARSGSATPNGRTRR